MSRAREQVNSGERHDQLVFSMTTWEGCPSSLRPLLTDHFASDARSRPENKAPIENLKKIIGNNVYELHSNYVSG